jgi:hypothetical protein
MHVYDDARYMMYDACMMYDDARYMMYDACMMYDA